MCCVHETESMIPKHFAKPGLASHNRHYLLANREKAGRNKFPWGPNDRRPSFNQTQVLMR